MVRVDSIAIFKHACQNVVDNADQKSLNYCVNYAKHGLTVTDKHEAHVQAPYILNNMTHWRGVIATETRNILKNFVKSTG